MTTNSLRVTLDIGAETEIDVFHHDPAKYPDGHGVVHVNTYSENAEAACTLSAPSPAEALAWCERLAAMLRPLVPAALVHPDAEAVGA